MPLRELYGHKYVVKPVVLRPTETSWKVKVRVKYACISQPRSLKELRDPAL